MTYQIKLSHTLHKYIYKNTIATYPHGSTILETMQVNPCGQIRRGEGPLPRGTIGRRDPTAYRSIWELGFVGGG